VYQLRVFYPHVAWDQPTVIGVALCLKKLGHPMVYMKPVITFMHSCNRIEHNRK